MIEQASALLLLGATIATWFVAAGARPAARVHLRFAAVLFAALAVSLIVVASAASAVALIVLPIAFSVLSLAAAAGFARALEPALAASLLALVSLAALAAAIGGWAALALAPGLLAALAIAVLALRSDPPSLQGAVAALCFAGAASAFAAEGAHAPLALFCAAGLLGLVLALSRSDAGVEERPGRDLREGLVIRMRSRG